MKTIIIHTKIKWKRISKRPFASQVNKLLVEFALVVYDQMDEEEENVNYLLHDLDVERIVKE